MKTLQRLIAKARENSEEMEVTELFDGELIGGDTIDKEILESNILVDEEIQADLAAIDEAVAEADEMGDIAAGLVGEEVPYEGTPVQAVEAFAKRINTVRQKYGMSNTSFSRESFDGVSDISALAKEAIATKEGIFDIAKDALKAVGKKLSSAIDAAAKNDRYIKARIEQVAPLVDSMGDVEVDSFKFEPSKCSPEGFLAGIKAADSFIKKVGGIAGAVSASLTAIDKSKKDNFAAGERKIKSFSDGNIAGLCTSADFFLTIVDNIIVDHEITVKFAKSTKVYDQALTSKEAKQLLGAVKSLYETYTKATTDLSKASNAAHEAITDIETSEYAIRQRNEFRAFAGDTSMFTIIKLQQLLAAASNDALRYIEKSAKARKA